jgi:CrcB protein
LYYNQKEGELKLLNLLSVFLGGGIGASLRYFVTLLSHKYFGFSHWGTFGSNIIGCFLIGYIFGLTLEKADLFPPHIKLFLTVGFLGGLTTFSTFSNEAFCFLKDGKIMHCAFYVTASLIIGLLATVAGYMLAK